MPQTGGEKVKVILYKTTTCPKCKIIAAKLDAKGIEYEIVEDIQRAIADGIQTVPTLIVDGVKYVDVKACNDWVNEQGG